MDYNRFLKLVARKNSGELSLPEQKELLNFINQNEAYKAEAAAIEDVFKIPFNETLDIEDGDVERNWASLYKKSIEKNSSAVIVVAKNHKKIRWVYGLVAAASIVALIAGSFLYFNNNGKEREKQSIVSTKKGSKTKLSLPDGSMVWLNADSKISYDADLFKSKREVTLSGEAYFDVVKDAAHPFIVHTPAIHVKVLGTAFNVKAYADDKSTEATLIRGVIEVVLNTDSFKKIILKPNEKFSVLNNYQNITENAKNKKDEVPLIAITEISKPANDTVAIETQWVANRLAFNNERLEDIVVKLSRWYGTEIEISNENLKNKEYSGIFEEESLQQVIDALKLTGGFHYTIEKNKIIIVP